MAELDCLVLILFPLTYRPYRLSFRSHPDSRRRFARDTENNGGSTEPLRSPFVTFHEETPVAWINTPISLPWGESMPLCVVLEISVRVKALSIRSWLGWLRHRLGGRVSAPRPTNDLERTVHGVGAALEDLVAVFENTLPIDRQQAVWIAMGGTFVLDIARDDPGAIHPLATPLG
jgi:hypothetical protein